MTTPERTLATVYYAPTARRRYLTRKAAVRAEARALIRAKYPTERAEVDDYGRTTDPGWHWTQDERLVRLCDRLTAIISRRQPPPTPGALE